jgi:S1-C subfamily serine protease
VVAVVALSGGDETSAQPEPPNKGTTASGDLSTADIADKAKAQSVEINVSGPEFDASKGRDVNSKNGGTGIIVDADQGLVVTNSHVVSGKTAINVQLADGTQASAVVEGEAPCEDLAVIRLRPVPDGLSAVTFGDSDAMQIGVPLVAGGYPGGFTDDIEKREFQATEGTLSQEASRIPGTTLDPVTPDALQHQAPVRPGMSGGPLMNAKGEVIGLNTFGTGDASTENLDVAISSKRMQQLLKDLEAGKNTGYVGWSELDTVPYGSRDALVVGRIKSGSPAAKRALTSGEVLLKLDGTPISTVPEMCSILNSKSSGDSLEVTSVPGSVWKRWNGTDDIGQFLNRQQALTKNVTLE